MSKNDEMLKDLMNAYNLTVQEDFEGFSPNDMYGLLHAPFDTTRSCMRLNTEIDERLLEDLCFIGDLRYFLRRIRELQPFKMTAKGNLPRKFCRELVVECACEEDLYYFRKNRELMREDESNYITLLDNFPRLIGMTKVRKNHISLTKRGEKLLDAPLRAFFLFMFVAYCDRFAWLNEDYYPEASIIQGSFAFSIFLVQKYGDRKRKPEFYFRKFLRAFPGALRGFEDKDYRSGEDSLRTCYELRVFKRFMSRFGLITIHPEDDKPRWFIENYKIQKTELIDSLVRWDRDMFNRDHEMSMFR